MTGEALSVRRRLAGSSGRSSLMLSARHPSITASGGTPPTAWQARGPSWRAPRYSSQISASSAAQRPKLMAPQSEIRTVLKTLKKQFPNPGAMEIGGSLPAGRQAYRTLVAVILSARTRDEQVLKLLPEFFEAYPNVEKLAEATPKQIETKINTIGMYRQKAKNLQKMAQRIQEVHGGKIPKTMEELVSLCGVGRKTASVILVACFEKPAIAVDTHVHRVTNRLGWVKTNTPEKTEAALLKIIPRDVQKIVNQVFVKFGRYICIPGRPRCWMCPIRKFCAYTNKNMQAPRDAEEIRDDLARRERELEILRKKVL